MKDTKSEHRDQNQNIIFGRNPVIEPLKSGRAVEKVLVSSSDGSARQIIAMAKEKGIPIVKTERQALDRIGGGASHQGVAAYVSAYAYAQMDDILAKAQAPEKNLLLSYWTDWRIRTIWELLSGRQILRELTV